MLLLPCLHASVPAAGVHAARGPSLRHAPPSSPAPAAPLPPPLRSRQECLHPVCQLGGQAHSQPQPSLRPGQRPDGGAGALVRHACMIGPHAVGDGDGGSSEPPGGCQAGDAEVKRGAAASGAGPAAGEALRAREGRWGRVGGAPGGVGCSTAPLSSHVLGLSANLETRVSAGARRRPVSGCHLREHCCRRGRQPHRHHHVCKRAQVGSAGPCQGGM